MATTLPTWQSNGQFNPERYVPVQYSADFLKDMMANQIKQYQLAKEAADSDWLKGFKREELAEQIRGHDLTHEAQMAQANAHLGQLKLAQDKFQMDNLEKEQEKESALFQAEVKSAISSGLGKENTANIIESLRGKYNFNNPKIAGIIAKLNEGQDFTQAAGTERSTPAYVNTTNLTNYNEAATHVDQVYIKNGAESYSAALNTYGTDLNAIYEKYTKGMKFKNKDQQQSFADDFNTTVKRLVDNGFSPEVAAFATIKAVDNGLVPWSKDFDYSEAKSWAKTIQKGKELYPEYKKFKTSQEFLAKVAPTYSQTMLKQASRLKKIDEYVEAQSHLSPLQKAELRVRLRQQANREFNANDETIRKAMQTVLTSAKNPRLQSGLKVEGDTIILPPPPKEEPKSNVGAVTVRKQVNDAINQFNSNPAAYRARE